MTDQPNNNQVQESTKSILIERCPHDRKNPYAQITRDILQNPDLSFELRGFLSFLLSLPDNWKISAAHIQKTQKISKRRYQKLINEAVEKGYMMKVAYKDKKFKNLNRYRWHVSETPKFKKCFPADRFGTARDTNGSGVMPLLIKKEEEEVSKEEEKKNKRNARSSRSRAKPPDIIFSFEKKKFLNITNQDLKAWEKAYPNVGLSQEMEAAIQWLLANPSKQNKTLWRKFLTGWFSREQRSAKERKATGKVVEKTVVSPQEKEELERVYKKYNTWIDQLSDPMILNAGRLELLEKTIIHIPSNLHSKKTLDSFKIALKRYCKLSEDQIQRIFK